MDIEKIISRMSEGERKEASRILSRQGFDSKQRLSLASILLEAVKPNADEYPYVVTLDDPWATIDPHDPPEEFSAYIEGEYQRDPGCSCCPWERAYVDQALTFDIEKGAEGTWTATATLLISPSTRTSDTQEIVYSYTYNPEKEP